MVDLPTWRLAHLFEILERAGTERLSQTQPGDDPAAASQPQPARVMSTDMRDETDVRQ
jgi:hypothetical protein